MKRTLALILTVLLTLSIVPVAFAEPTKDAALDAALNGEGQTNHFEGTGDYVWQPANIDGRNAAISTNKNVHDSTSTFTLSKTLAVGDVIAFDYKTSCETGYDFFIVTINGDEVVNTSGEFDWRTFISPVEAAGSYYIVWSYVKDDEGSSDTDCAWVDEVVVGTAPEMSDFTVSPENMTVGVSNEAPITFTPIPAAAAYNESDIEWFCADTTVATVDGGIVTGISEGTTEVTVTYGSISHTINITVAEDLIADGYVVYATDADLTSISWTRFGLLSQTFVTIDMLPVIPYAAEFHNGTIYALAPEENNSHRTHFYTQDYKTRAFTDIVMTGMFYDMAYDYSTQTMYVIGEDDYRNPTLCKLNLETGAVTLVGAFPVEMLTLGCTTDGLLFGISQPVGRLYSINKTNAEVSAVGLTGIYPSYVQSMAFDHTNNTMYWASCTNDDQNTIVSVNLSNGQTAEVFPQAGEICGLFFAIEDPNIDPVHATGVTVSPTSLDLQWNETAQLTATVSPSDATNKGVIWSTSNTNVATVSIMGLVKGVGSGTATITATTRDGGFTATCTVTVGDAPIYLLYEDFEDALTGWTLVDADGDDHGWDYYPDGPYEGLRSFSSASYLNEGQSPLTPDNWFISPAFTASADCDLSWFACAQDEQWADENYTVYIGSATAVTPDQFTTVLYNGFTPIEWTEYVIALDEYAGESVRIAFRHHDCTDMYVMKIDMISVMDFSGGVTPPSPTPTPSGTTYTVTFVDWDDTVLAEVEVNEGEDATAPTDPEREGHLFFGWDGEFTNVQSDLTIKATYRAFGDANVDGNINTGDAVVILRYAVEDITFDEFQVLIADVNHDEKVNTGDAVTVLILCVS